MKFGFNWPSGFRGLKMLTYIHTYGQHIRMTEAYLYYKLTNESKCSGELIKSMIRPLYLN